MCAVYSSTIGTKAYIPDIFYECVAINGHMGSDLTVYNKACQNRETCVRNHSVQIVEQEANTVFDVYAGCLSAIGSYQYEDRYVYLLEASQTLLAKALHKNSDILLLLKVPPDIQPTYLKLVIHNAWKLGHQYDQLGPLKIEMVPVSILETLQSLLSAFARQNQQEQVIGIIDSMLYQESLIHCLRNKTAMSQQSPEKTALGEMAVWLKFSKRKDSNNCRLGTFLNISCDASDLIEEKIHQILVNNSHYFPLSISNILCVGNYDAAIMKQLHLMQQICKRTTMIKPKLQTVNAICGEVGAATIFLLLAIAQDQKRSLPHHMTSLIWVNSTLNSRDLMLLQ